MLAFMDRAIEAIHDPRLHLAVRIERTVVAARYLAYVLLAALLAMDAPPAHSWTLLIIAVGGLGHNAFVHWVVHARRYALLQSPLNFLIHLLEITGVVALTGAGESPLFVLYLLLIVAHAAYSHAANRTAAVTGISVFAYAALVWSHWGFGGFDPDWSVVGIRVLSMLTCGWLVAMLRGYLSVQEAEADVRARARATSEATVRAILDSTSDPILVHDEDEFIIDVNNKACEFLGLRREGIIGQRFRSFLFDDGTLPNKLAALHARGEYYGEAMAVKPDGEERNVELHMRSFILDDRRLIVSTWHDITGIKAVQEAARLATLQLEEANRELQRINELKSSFIANVSRRLRSPLAAIIGFTTLLLNEEAGELTENQRRAVQHCQNSARRVLELVDQVFEPGPGNGRERTAAARSEEQRAEPR